MAQQVKDLALSLLWQRTLLWLRFNPRPGNAQPKKKNKKQTDFSSLQHSCKYIHK